MAQTPPPSSSPPQTTNPAPVITLPLELTNTLHHLLTENTLRAQENQQLHSRLEELTRSIKGLTKKPSPNPPLNPSLNNNSSPSQTSSSSPSSHDKIGKLSPFSRPSPTDSLSDWIFACKQHIYHLRIPEDQQVAFAARHLAGDARAW